VAHDDLAEQLSVVRQRRASFAAVAGAMVLVFAGANLVAPLWPIYRGEMHLTNVALTIVFAAYTLGALGALFGFGGLSDLIGRKPLLIAAVAGTIVASLLFAFAADIVWLIAARFAQGLAVGAVSSSANAALNDFAYRDDPRHPALIGSIATSVGFAAGPFAAGILADTAPDPTQTSFFVLCIGATIALISLLRLPNAGRRPGAAFTGNRASVPRPIRAAFVRAAATFTVGWVAGTLFLSLGPSIIATLLGTASHTVAGATLLAFFTASGVAQFAARGLSPRDMLRCGSAAVAAGLLIAAGATVLHALPLFFIGIALTGAAQGIGLLGGLAVINAIAPAHQRGGVLAAFFFCGYLAVTLCVPLLGWVADAHGLDTAVTAFAAVLATAAALAFADLTRWRGPAPVMAGIHRSAS
jgi:MFS family permease